MWVKDMPYWYWGKKLGEFELVAVGGICPVRTAHSSLIYNDSIRSLHADAIVSEAIVHNRCKILHLGGEATVSRQAKRHLFEYTDLVVLIRKRFFCFYSHYFLVRSTNSRTLSAWQANFIKVYFWIVFQATLGEGDKSYISPLTKDPDEDLVLVAYAVCYFRHSYIKISLLVMRRWEKCECIIKRKCFEKKPMKYLETWVPDIDLYFSSMHRS